MARWVTAVSAAGALAVMFTATFAGVATAGEPTPAPDAASSEAVGDGCYDPVEISVGLEDGHYNSCG